MNKEFVPYNESLELKALGFDEPCFGKYLSNLQSDRKKFELILEMGMNEEFEDNRNIYLLEEACSSPTFSQAFRFFREKYGIFTSIVPNKYGSLDSFIGWIYVPSNGTTKDINVGDRKGFSTPEEAELACLVKLIEIVKQK